MGDERDSERAWESDSSSDLFDDASNVLLLGSPMDSHTFETGLSLLTGDDPETTHVLWVTLLNTPREVVDIWDGHCAVRPRQLRIVLVGDGLSLRDTVADESVGIHTVPDPADLTTLGVRVLNALSALESTSEDAAIYFRFDSLTPLSQYVSPQGLAQFLHALTTRLADAGVRSHFHLDPMAHDTKTVHTLGSIFDAQVRVDDDGTSVIRR